MKGILAMILVFRRFVLISSFFCLFGYQQISQAACACTDARKAQELGYIRTAFRIAWQEYMTRYPWAGRGWRANVEQSGVDILNAIASLPGQILVAPLNAAAGSNVYYVKPGPDFGVRCQQIFDGMMPRVFELLRATNEKFHCYRVGQAIQDGIRGSSLFNHVYPIVVAMSETPNVENRDMTKIRYFADPWGLGTAKLFPGIGVVPKGAWAGKSVELGRFMGSKMPKEDDPDNCGRPSSCRTTGLSSGSIFYLRSSTWSGSPGFAKAEIAYSFNLTMYLTQLANWDYLRPWNGNPYGLLWASPESWRAGYPSTLSDFAGGAWRIVQYQSEETNENDSFINFGAEVVAMGSLSPNASLIDPPASVNRIATTAAPYDQPTGIPAMSTATALEVSCDGTWPVKP